MNWTVNNVYDYRGKPLRGPNGLRWRWYTDGGGNIVLRQDEDFGQIIVDSRNLMDLLAELNRLSLEPAKSRT